MIPILPSKDPDNEEPYFVIWCDKETGLNDGSKNDRGELQGAAISTVTWIMPVINPPELVKKSSNQDALTIAGIEYDINTVATIWLEGGIANKDYSITCRIVTDDNRQLDKTIVIPVREN